MRITEVRVFPVDEDKLKAYASIVFDDCFIVNDLKVIQGKKGLFLSMPSRRRKRGGYRDIAHPLNNETRDRIEERVIAEYCRTVEGEAAEMERRDLVGPDSEEGSESEVSSEAGRLAVVRSLEPGRDRDGGSELAASAETDVADEELPGRPSLEEVEKEHLSDSFWSVS